MDLEDGVHIILVECEVPAAYDTCRAKRIDDAFGNDFVQAQEVDCNRDAVCPWAVAGPDEAVTARLYRELALPLPKEAVNCGSSSSSYFFLAMLKFEASSPSPYSLSMPLERGLVDWNWEKSIGQGSLRVSLLRAHVLRGCSGQ